MCLNPPTERATPVATIPSTPAPLRVGVIGLGMGAVHLEAYAAMPDVEVVALAGKEEARLAELGAQYGVRHLLADWADLVTLPDVDAVSIATPNALHHPITMAALAASASRAITAVRHLTTRTYSVAAGRAYQTVRALRRSVWVKSSPLNSNG